MASSGNTWQKKLMNKARLQKQKAKGVKQRFAVDGIKLEDYRAAPMPQAFGRQPKRYGSTNSAG
jgi:uncharacterized lipoprotein YddW (UPF0748 family)